MAIVVQKYGGSSVADVGRLRQVADAVVARHRSGDDVVVVVSAMGKTTDNLMAQAKQIAAEPSRRELDMLVTAGERISMALLSMAIHEVGGVSISLTGSQSGIITEDSHQGARILEVRPYRVEEALARRLIVIVAGYQGVSRKREVTTLGRGGSDTTAVALAAALGASACEIYSDVDGVYSADPNVCQQARHLPRLPYEVMQTLAGAGAKVLNADAVEFAKRAGIVIHARKTSDVSGRETVVDGEAAVPSGVVAVASAPAVTRLMGPARNIDELAAAVMETGGRIMALSMGADVDALVDRTGIPGRDPLPVVARAQMLGLMARDVSVVSLVGTSLLTRPQLWRAARMELDDAGILVHTVFATDVSGAFVVEPSQCDAAVRALHATVT